MRAAVMATVLALVLSTGPTVAAQSRIVEASLATNLVPGPVVARRLSGIGQADWLIATRTFRSGPTTEQPGQQEHGVSDITLAIAVHVLAWRRTVRDLGVSVSWVL